MRGFLAKLLLFLVILTFAFGTLSCTKRGSNDILKIIDVDLTEEEYVFVCKKGNSSLVQDMNSFMSDIKNSGEFDTLIAKYFEGTGEKIGYPISTDDVDNTEGNLIVVTNCPFEPFEYMEEDGKIYGLDIEIAAAYARSRGLELVIKNIGFEDIFVQVDSGYADIGMAGITATPERAEAYAFTEPYYNASQKLVVLTENEAFDECKGTTEVEGILFSLKDEKIGYQSATTASLYVNGDEDWGFDGFANIHGKAYANAQVAITDLINGNLYGVILDEAPTSFIVESMNAQQNSSWAVKFKNFFETISNEQYLNIFLKGIANTVAVAVIGLIIGIVIGIIIAIIRVAPKYKLIYKVLDKICSFYTLIFRGTPIVAQLLIAYYVIMPTIGIKMGALGVGMIVFGMNSGAYVSEIMRGGLNSVDKGQMEAGRALGMTYSSTMMKIVVPQAVKNILPTLGNEFISLIKETSVLSFIAVYDLYKALLDVGMVKYDSMVPYIMMGLIYIVLVLIISLGIKLLERRFAKSDRN